MTEMNTMPPPYSKGGYSRLPQSDPQYGYRATPPSYPPSSYAPAPPVMQQQSSNTNVVVVGQPSTVPHTTIVQPQPRANEYLILTLVLMALCFVHGNLPAFFCLVPALICSCVASDHNNAGSFDNAKQCGNMALGCNICAIIKYVIFLLVGIALVVVYFTVGFSWLYAAKKDAEDAINNGVKNNGYNCYQTCTTDVFGSYSCSQFCTNS